ncbi:unnamed protein product [Paramecium pentaurelia]|uniref:Alpha-1,4 glucan phosphorylase n=1 Tax=Paramecium pentaurelia TaxID=43138 RepID=A0A8S1SMC4_9CILI|nr:unnamed protein product [Paramecium pentaurelia]
MIFGSEKLFQLLTQEAAPGYLNTKRINKLITSVAEVINHDLNSNYYLKVVFLQNSNVSQNEFMIPASDISQHISTAGKEASNTSNMKFVRNGVNIEISQEVGLDNIFIFGAKFEKASQLINSMKNTGPYKYIQKPLWSVIESIKSGILDKMLVIKRKIEIFYS